jgi:hypothetical protein
VPEVDTRLDELLHGHDGLIHVDLLSQRFDVTRS